MDTPRYRIGNDITIFWAINNRDGSPYDLDGKEVRLFVTNDRGREEVEVEITKLSDSIRNNVLKWDFKGDDQRILGKYTLTLVVLETETHRELTKDYAEAFTLVSRSEMENEEGDANISTGGDLILASKLDIYRIQATNVDVAGLKNQIYDVEKGLTTKVEKQEFDEKTGKFDNAFVKIEASIKGINTEIKDASGEMTQIKQTIDGIEVSVGDLEYKVESLEKQTDGAIEKWFYPGVPGPDQLPESNWKTDQEKYSHLGDLYYDENTGIAYRYITKDNQYLWVIIEDADIIAALEAAKNNNRTFIDQPKTPYKVGDLWIAEKDYEETGIKQDDIVVCIITREEGQFDINDWQRKGNSINDEDLADFVDNYYNNTILPEINKQVDQMAAAHYGAEDPSLEWEEGTEAEHKGDLWYNTNTNRAYYWSGTAWVESDVPEEVFDKIDGKNSIYVTIPNGKPYKENDLWFVEKNYEIDGFNHNKGEILVALEDAVYDENKEAYNFLYSDWVKRDTYTDDTAVKNLDEYIRGGFKNGVLDESEKSAIESAWDSIVLAQDQLTQDYLTVILPGFTLPEFAELQKAYKAVYNDQPSEEYPNLGTFQLLENAVIAILNYEVTEEESTLHVLLEAYDNAYDAYRTALSNYSIAYGKFTNAIRAELGQANEYIEAIIDDGKLTPIEKKQLLEVYKSLSAEYSGNVDTAFTAKIWKYDNNGNEVPGAYAGPKGVGQEYFDIYVAYKEAYSPILAVFTGTDWGFDKMDETTTFNSGINLTQLDAYFDIYYEALIGIAHVISVVSEEKAEASLAMKEYMDDLEEVLTPTEAITQIGKGVVLSSVIGVGTYDEQSGKYLLKAGMNASAKDTADLVTMNSEHGRVVFVGGANGLTDWNNAPYVVYEDGHVIQLSGKIGKNVQIGEAVLQSVIADEINLLSYPEYDEVTGETKLTPLFQVNTKTDASGKKKIVSISSVYDLYVNGNLIVEGDTSSGGSGQDTPASGTVTGIKVGPSSTDILTPNTAGIIDMVSVLSSIDVSDQLTAYAKTEDVNAALLTKQDIISDLATIRSGAALGATALQKITKDMVDSVLGSTAAGNANRFLMSTGSTSVWSAISKDMVTDALGYTPANNASLANYLPLSGGTLTASKREVLYLNTTAAYCDLTLQINKVDKAVLSYDATHGVYVYSYPSGKYIGVKDDGTPYYNNGSYNTLIHSGNIGSYAFVPKSDNLTSNVNADNYVTNGAYLNQTGSGSGNSNFPQSYSIFATFAQSERYLAQLSIGYNSFYFRRKIDTWDEWREVIHNGNIGSYAVLAGKWYDSGVEPARNSTGLLNGVGAYMNVGYNSDFWFRFYVDGSGLKFSSKRSDSELTGKTIAFTDSTVDNAKILVDADNAYLIYKTSAGHLYVGDNIYTSGDTHILGKNIRLRYGTSASYGFILNESGNVTIGASDLAGTNYKLMVDGLLGMMNGTNKHGVLGFSDNNLYLGYSNVQFGTVVNGQTVSFQTTHSSTPKVHITHLGNVLIGTTTDDGAKLYVNGDAKFGKTIDLIGNNASSARLVIKEVGANVNYIHLYVDTNNSTTNRALVLQNGYGNVGIGTTYPQFKLDVNGSARISAAANNDAYWRAKGSQYEIGFGVGSGNVNRGLYDFNNTSWMIYRDSTTNVIIPQGNVLIGTTKDASKLTVSAKYRNALPSLGSLSADSDMAIHFDSDSAGYGMYFSINGYTGASTIQVGRNDGNTNAYSLLLNPLGGNVGIGIASPAYKLDVAGTGNFSVGIKANEVLLGSAGLYKGSYWSSSLSDGDMVISGGKISLTGAVTMSSTLSVGSHILATTGGTANIGSHSTCFESLYLNGGAFFGQGRAGIYIDEAGVNWKNANSSWVARLLEFTQTLVTLRVAASTSSNLSVGGTLTVAGLTTINNNLVVSGDTSSGSDIRFKDIIKNKTIKIEHIAKAPLFTFKWNDREDDTIHLGSSAQYWEKVTPWLVKGEGFKTLDYSTLGVAMGISLAKKAVNHEERIKVLEKENKALKEEIRRMQYGS